MRLVLTLIRDFTQNFVAHLERNLAGKSRVFDVLDMLATLTAWRDYSFLVFLNARV